MKQIDLNYDDDMFILHIRHQLAIIIYRANKNFFLEYASCFNDNHMIASAIDKSLILKGIDT